MPVSWQTYYLEHLSVVFTYPKIFSRVFCKAITSIWEGLKPLSQSRSHFLIILISKVRAGEFNFPIKIKTSGLQGLELWRARYWSKESGISYIFQFMTCVIWIHLHGTLTTEDFIYRWGYSCAEIWVQILKKFFLYNVLPLVMQPRPHHFTNQCLIPSVLGFHGLFRVPHLVSARVGYISE